MLGICAVLDAWLLELLWSLEFGFWNFPQAGCPTWIRTMTNASKGHCATITPSDKAFSKYPLTNSGAKEKCPPAPSGQGEFKKGELLSLAPCFSWVTEGLARPQPFQRFPRTIRPHWSILELTLALGPSGRGRTSVFG